MPTHTKPTDALPVINLFYREGSSDKVYRVAIEPLGDGYAVRYAFGRRGSALNTGQKNAVPVSLEQATKLLQRLVTEKKAKGYTEDASGKPVAMPVAPATQEDGKVLHGRLPQLLNPLDEDDIETMLAKINGTWCAQEKYDGKRILLHKTPTGTVATQRQGKPCAVPAALVTAAEAIAGTFLVDGELVGDKYWVFDLLRANGTEWRHRPYGNRLEALTALLGSPTVGALHLAPTAFGQKDVRTMYAALKTRNAEGIVFKDRCAPYTAGRPNSGGPQLKVKFWASCSCIVLAHNQQRSVAMALTIDDQPGKGLEIGNVTIPVGHAVPPVGSVIEVRYLYAYPGGSLYQPQYEGERTDIPYADCTVSKQRLKYKAGATTEPEE